MGTFTDLVDATFGEHGVDDERKKKKTGFLAMVEEEFGPEEAPAPEKRLEEPTPQPEKSLHHVMPARKLVEEPPPERPAGVGSHDLALRYAHAKQLAEPQIRRGRVREASERFVRGSGLPERELEEMRVMAEQAVPTEYEHAAPRITQLREVEEYLAGLDPQRRRVFEAALRSQDPQERSFAADLSEKVARGMMSVENAWNLLIEGTAEMGPREPAREGTAFGRQMAAQDVEGLVAAHSPESPAIQGAFTDAARLLVEMAPAIAGGGVATPYWFLRSAMPVAAELTKAGVDADTTAKVAILAGIFNAALERAGFESMFGGNVRRGVSGLLLSPLVAAFGEGLTEGAQGFNESLAVSYGKEFGGIDDPERKQRFMNALEEASRQGSAVMGSAAIIGVGSGGVAAQPQMEKRLARSQRTLGPTRPEAQSKQLMEDAATQLERGIELQRGRGEERTAKTLEDVRDVARQRLKEEDVPRAEELAEKTLAEERVERELRPLEEKARKAAKKATEKPLPVEEELPAPPPATAPQTERQKRLQKGAEAAVEEETGRRLKEERGRRRRREKRLDEEAEKTFEKTLPTVEQAREIGRKGFQEAEEAMERQRTTKELLEAAERGERKARLKKKGLQVPKAPGGKSFADIQKAAEKGKPEAAEEAPKLPKMPKVKVEKEFAKAEKQIEAKLAKHKELREPRFFTKKVEGGYNVIRWDNKQEQLGEPVSQKEARKVAGQMNQRYEREAKVIQEKLDPAVQRHFDRRKGVKAVYDAKTGKTYTRPGAKFTPLKKGAPLKDTLLKTQEGAEAHEKGEAVFNQMDDAAREQWIGFHAQLTPEQRSLRKTSKPREDFADMWALKQTDPEALAEQMPEVARFFELNEKEFKEPTPERKPASETAKKRLNKMAARYGVKGQALKGLIDRQSQGRATSPDDMTSKEAKRVEKQIAVEGISANMPDGVAEMLRTRNPADAEIEQYTKMGSEAAEGVKSRRDPFRGAPTKERKAARGIRAWIANTPLWQIFGTGQVSHQFLVDDMFPEGPGRQVLSEDLFDGQDREATFKFLANDVSMKAKREAGITDRQMAKMLKGKRRMVELPSQKVEMSVADMLHIEAVARDPHGQDALTKEGFTFGEGSVEQTVLTPADVAFIRKKLRDEYAGFVGVVAADHKFDNATGKTWVQDTHRRETGLDLTMQEDYHHLQRDQRWFEGKRAEQLSPEFQRARHINDILHSHVRYEMKRAGEQAKAELKAAKQLATPAERKAEKTRIRKELAEKKKGFKRAKQLAGKRSGAGRTLVRRAAPSGIGTPTFTMARGATKAPLVIGNYFDKRRAYIDSVAHYVGKAVPVRNAYAMLSNMDLKDAVITRFRDGEKRLKRLKGILDVYAGVDFTPQSWLSKVIGGMLRRAQSGALALRLAVPAYQGVSASNAVAAGLPAKHLAASTSASHKAALAEIEKHSPWLRGRLSGYSHRILSPSLTQEAGDATRSYWLETPQTLLDTVGMGLVRKVDAVTLTRIWAACKRWAAADGKTGDALMKETAKRANGIVRRSQPTWDELTLPFVTVKARKNAALKIYTVFSSQASKSLGQSMDAVSKYRWGEISGKEMAKRVVLASIVPAVLITLIRQALSRGLKGLAGSEEEEYKGIAWETIERLIGGWVVGRDIVKGAKKTYEAMRDKNPYKLRSLGSDDLFSRIFQDAGMAAAAFAKYIEADEFKKDAAWVRFVQEFMQHLSSFYGLPTGGAEQIARPFVKKSLEE